MPTGLQRRVRKQPASRGGSVSKKTHMGPVAVAQAVRSASELKALQSFRMIFGSARIHDADVRRISGLQLWALSANRSFRESEGLEGLRGSLDVLVSVMRRAAKASAGESLMGE